MSEVIVVGSLNVDLVVQVEALPRPGETVTGGSFRRSHGGKGGNAATAAARWGAAVRFVGAVGDDELGSSARQALVADSIDVAGLIEVDRPTGVALIVVDAAGENQIAVAPGANAALEARHLEDLGALRPGGVLCSNLEVSDAVILEAAERCTSAGMRFVLDPAPAREMPEAIYELGPILVPNLGEAEMLSGVHGAEAAATRLHDRTGAPVIVTLGASGALLVDPDGGMSVPSASVQAVDATGAGDTFCGVFAAELASGNDARACLGSACQAATLSVTKVGARGGMPTREEVEAWVRG